jgi:hypothetical protein
MVPSGLVMMWSTPYQQATVAPWLTWRSFPPPAAKGLALRRPAGLPDAGGDAAAHRSSVVLGRTGGGKGSSPLGRGCDWRAAASPGQRNSSNWDLLTSRQGFDQVRQSLPRCGGPRSRPSGRRGGPRPSGMPGWRAHRGRGRASHPPTGGQGLSRGGSHGDSQQAATRSSNSARTQSSSPSTRSTKTSSAICCVFTVIDLTPSTTTCPVGGSVRAPGQASICLRSLSAFAIAILRGLACSAIGILSVSTPAS